MSSTVTLNTLKYVFCEYKINTPLYSHIFCTAASKYCLAWDIPQELTINLSQVVLDYQ